MFFSEGLDKHNRKRRSLLHAPFATQLKPFAEEEQKWACAVIKYSKYLKKMIFVVSQETIEFSI